MESKYSQGCLQFSHIEEEMKLNFFLLAKFYPEIYITLFSLRFASDSNLHTLGDEWW